MSTQEAPYGMVREGFKKNVDLSTFASDPHPPPYVEKNKKNMLFFGFLAQFSEVFSPCHPLEPSTTATHDHHQLLMHPIVATPTMPWWWRILVVGSISGGWLW